METIYNATPNRLMKISGLACSALMLGIGGVMFYMGFKLLGKNGGTSLALIGAGLISILGFLGALLFIPRGYRLTPAMVVVWRWGPKVRIPLSQIRELRRVKVTKVIKVCGGGGFFGSWGLFYTADRSNGFAFFSAYITRHDTEVAIYRKEGRPLVLSPDQPEDFIRAVKERISSGG